MNNSRTEYKKRVQDRTFFRFFIGLVVRFWNYLKYSIARYIAQRNGAKIGEGVIMPISLAKKLNVNCKIGNHVSIQTCKLDTMASLNIW